MPQSFVRSHLEAVDILQGKAPALLVLGDAADDVLASAGAVEVMTDVPTQARMYQIERMAYLVSL